MQDIPPELQHWPQMLSRMQLQLLSDTINICESHLQPYIVRTGDTVAEMESTEAASDEAAAVEVKLKCCSILFEFINLCCRQCK